MMTDCVVKDSLYICRGCLEKMPFWDRHPALTLIGGGLALVFIFGMLQRTTTEENYNFIVFATIAIAAGWVLYQIGQAKGREKQKDRDDQKRSLQDRREAMRKRGWSEEQIAKFLRQQEGWSEEQIAKFLRQ